MTEFDLRDGTTIRAVDNVDVSVQAGEVLGLVGESGSGKSVTALSIGGLVRQPGCVSAGEIRIDGRDLRKLKRSELREYRAHQIGFVFQDPQASLNPVMSIGDQVLESLRAQGTFNRREGRALVIEMLSAVGISDAAARYSQFPHQFSGGMRQRVMIAMALIRKPRLLIADEPTTALDVTVQAQILRLLRSIVDQVGLAMLLITHDFGVASAICDRVAVMYAGQIVETGDLSQIINRASHPYTKGLIASVPRMAHPRGQPLPSIPRTMVRGVDPDACRFIDRCPLAKAVCGAEIPTLNAVEEGHMARCFALGPNGWMQ